MIVVDSNVIAHALITSECSSEVLEIWKIDSEWNAPLLWISELRSTLLKYIRIGHFSIFLVNEVLGTAREMMSSGTGTVGDEHVLRLAVDSGCSTYDCEFVAMAQQLDAPLLTYDRKLLKAFPELAVTPGDWLKRGTP